jgi:hypothetical protein
MYTIEKRLAGVGQRLAQLEERPPALIRWMKN